MQLAGEVKVGFDRPEVRQHVGPGPPRHCPAVEVTGQSTAEVAAVDSARATDDGAPDDVDFPARPLGQHRRIVPHHTAGGTDGQPDAVGDLSRHPRIRRSGARFHHTDAATRILRQPRGKHRAGTARADNQDIETIGG